ncbi:probable malonyl-CoA-acyl carrier protein transacylase, mitochondrial [Nilaparvata lugens]|uniref:probable malonyl-CoA-acyl carrier protein transacylase, mitochondrial n=1 Tax=Nilaparvata lugens TaxID=108931 RepID=UPI00193CB2CA|nr:probable malonyl-CoA-acyl carrier protein transacylase, mitochondrial [Nilaparvata lugens]
MFLTKSKSFLDGRCILKACRSLSTSSLVRSTDKTSQFRLKEIDSKRTQRKCPRTFRKCCIFQRPGTRNQEEEWSTSPYPKGSIPRGQSIYSLRPKVDPTLTSIILFPGQGTQYVGMGRNLMKFPVVQEMFESASAILGYDLLKLCVQGPASELNKTVHCQLAVLVCSLAAVEHMREERPSAIENCIAAAGFSVGEISALVFAGAISFERAIRLTKVRGEAMQLASEMAEGGMLTVLYSPKTNLADVCKKANEWAQNCGVERPECSVANYLFPDCKVIAGHVKALEYIEKNAASHAIRRTRRLPVTGAFHTSLMEPALEPFKLALNNAKLNEPAIAVHSNLDGKMYSNAKQITYKLPRQIVRPVKWEQTLHILYERAPGEQFPNTYECGPGSSLRSILRMVNAKATNTFYNYGS